MPASILVADGSTWTYTGFTASLPYTRVTAQDGSWLTNNASATSTLRLSFPTPPLGPPRTGVDLQNFQLYLRKQPSGRTGIPTITDVRVYENGVDRGRVNATFPQSISSESGAAFNFKWNASLLQTADGSAVEIYVTFAQGGTGGQKTYAEVDYVKWDAECNVTMTADKGSYSESGKAATPRFTFPADRASVKLTGYAAALKIGFIFAAAKGAFSLTGYGATFKTAVPALKGGYLLSMNAATLRLKFAALKGAFTETGYSFTPRFNVPFAKGSFYTSFNAATLRLSLPAGKGAYTVTGYDATLTVEASQRLVAETGSFAVTGYAATPKITAPAAKGTFVVSTDPATLRLSVAASKGSFGVTGYAASYKQSVLASKGAFSVTPYAATLRLSFAASTGHVSASFKPAGLNQTWPVAHGEFSLTGYSAALRVGLNLMASKGTFTLSESPASFAFNVPCGKGAFVETGYSVAFRIGYLIVASAGSFFVDGNDAAFTTAFSASPASFLVNGSPAALKLGLAATSGHLALQGYDAALIPHLLLDAVKAQYIVHPYDANLRVEEFMLKLIAATGHFIVREGGTRFIYEGIIKRHHEPGYGILEYPRRVG